MNDNFLFILIKQAILINMSFQEISIALNKLGYNFTSKMIQEFLIEYLIRCTNLDKKRLDN